MKTLLCTLLVLVAPCYAQVVETIYGPVEGLTFPTFNGAITTNISSFLGVPFAQSTANANRFKKPLPPIPWTETFQATTLRSACPQGGGGIIDLTHPGWQDYGEDCLHVNIYAPADFQEPGKSYPVMLWLFGGSFSAGMNSQYTGYFLASYGVVVVTANYRLNVFGFATLANDACPGNFGLWDQKASLEFVRDNIAGFGGDPNKVTLFGESAGAASTSLCIVSPETKDLFHQAITESGSEKVVWAYQPPESQPENGVRTMAQNLNCNGTDEEIMECLRQFTWEEIYDNRRYDCAQIGYQCGYFPTIDGPGGFLPDTPTELRRNNGAMSGPLISGVNHDDAGGAIAELLGGWDCCTEEVFDISLQVVAAATLLFVDRNTTRDLYEALHYNYAPWGQLNNKDLNRERIMNLADDLAFFFGCDLQLKDQAPVAPTFGYVYNYRSRNMAKVLPEYMGVVHALEVPYVWGQTLIFLPGNEMALDHSGITNILLPVVLNHEDTLQTMFLQELWTNFAKTGNPTPYPVNNPSTIGGTTVWPQYTLENMKTLFISNTSMEAKDWRQKDFSWVTEYMPYVTNYELPKIGLLNSLSKALGKDGRDNQQSFLEDLLENFFSNLLTFDKLSGSKV